MRGLASHNPQTCGTASADKGSAPADAIRGASSPPNHSLSLSIKKSKGGTGTAPASRTTGPHHFLWRIDGSTSASVLVAAKENRDPHRRFAVASRSLTPSLRARAGENAS